MHDMRNGICPLCDHREVVERAAVEISIYNGEAPLTVTVESRRRLLASGRSRDTLGVVICRACGYVQWFAAAPGEIPIDDAHGTRLIRGPTREGYR